MSVLGHQDMIMLRWQQTVRSFTALLRTELVSGFCSDETYHLGKTQVGMGKRALHRIWRTG